MTTETSGEQESAGVRTGETDDEDAKGHRRFESEDPDFESRQPSVHGSVAPDEDHAEGRRVNPGRCSCA